MSIYKEPFSVVSYIILIFLLGSFSSCMPDQADDINNENRLMGSGYGINSSTLLVQDLDSAKKYYSEVLGFQTARSRGDKKEIYEGTKSERFSFPNMSSIKLLAVEDSVIVNSKYPFINTFLEENEGVRVYSLSSSSVDTAYTWLSSQGFKMDSIKSYRASKEAPKGWDRDNGEAQIHNLAFENINSVAGFPEFMEMTGFPYEKMYQWKSFYNMQRGFINHPNGAVGIIGLKIVVEDFEVAIEDFQTMGFTELEINPSERFARFKIKRNQELHIKSPESPNDELAQFLENRGPGVFAIRFEVKNLDTTYHFLKENLTAEALHFDSLTSLLTVSKEYAYGVQLEFKEEPEEQALMAEKLKLSFGSKLDTTAQKYAESLYIKYCALCHGKDREGYAADHAPSLRSHSLMGSAKGSNFLRYTVQYGRNGTAMAGFFQEQGGPLEYLEIELLLKWLEESSGFEKPVELSREPVEGDVELGSMIYAKNCVACHGENGEGITAPALGNPMLLATATDHFLRYAISEGRDGTPMPSFKESLNDTEIDAVTAFLRSRASGWDVPEVDSVAIPLPENYVLNPKGKTPSFELREGRYVSAKQVEQALKDSARFVLLDARSTVAWRQMHIPGAIPVPHYEEPEAFVEHIPNDSTWVVAYCACPHAASGKVINTLRRYGYKNTAIIDEGILVWAQEGYPVQSGR